MRDEARRVLVQRAVIGPDGRVAPAQVDVRLAAVVRDLYEDARAFRVNRVGDFLPGVDMGIRLDAGRAEIATAVVRRMRAFRNEQSALRRALAVILDHHRARAVVGVGAQTRHRRMHDAVRQLQRADPRRREQFESCAIHYGYLSNGS